MLNNDDKKPSFEELFKKLNDKLDNEEKKTIKKVKNFFTDYDPIKTAIVFCGLATVGCLQSNHIRISNLIHAALKFGNGLNQIKEKQIRKIFKLLEKSSIGRHEDPAEDVYIANICTQQGSYRIYEGNWEASSFFLERFIDIIDGMPDEGRYKITKRSVYALLHLSDLIALKSGADVNTVIGHYPESDIPIEVLLDPNLLLQKVRFSEDDLNKYGFNIEDILPFVFNITNCTNLPFPSHQSLTDLDKNPILKSRNGEYFLFPQGVSTAIRAYVIREYTTIKQDLDALTINLIRSYLLMLKNYFLLGDLNPLPINALSPISCGNVYIQEFMIEVSKGRPLHFIILFDGFSGDLNDWGMTNPVIIHEETIDLSRRISEAKKSIDRYSSLKHGITLIIFAGWGRSIGLNYNYQDTDDWSLHHMGMDELCHLSDYPKMKALNLWRIIMAEKVFKSLGGKIFNINGLLNIFGWLIKNEWHIVPHDDLPKEDMPTGMAISIPTNCLANVRMTARQLKDRQVVRNFDGIPIKVIRYSGSSYFREDEKKPIYICLESLMNDNLSAVVFGRSSTWWCSVDNPNKGVFDFRIWESAINFLPRIDKAINEFDLKVPNMIEWQFIIEEQKEAMPVDDQFVSTLIDQRKIITTIQIFPDSLWNRSDNCAESAMVKSFLHSLLMDRDELIIENLIQMIFPNKDAKFCHVFQARSYNDHIAELLPKAIIIEKSDDAILRLGLGWLDGTTGRFLKISGIKECVNHLNGIVDKVWNEIYKRLIKYGRVSLCEMLLLNMEAVTKERLIWERTIRALLSLHEDKDNVFDVANHEIGKFNAASIGCRLLIEMAVCTCPENGEIAPDELDLSILLGYAMLIFHLGTWSDAIKNSLFPPEIHISFFGQVLLHYGFEETVMKPYTSMFGRKQREMEAKEYERLYDDPVDNRPVEGVFPQEYLFAWKNEYQISVNTMRIIIDSLEDLGISRHEAIYKIKKSELVNHLQKAITSSVKQDISMFLSKISLLVRSKWNQDKNTLPNGMEPRDWHPWNFRRKLSLISRPIIELDNNEDPLLLVSPGCIRDGVWYLLFNSFYATFDERHFSSKEMIKWIGNRRNKLGNEFNKTVAQKFTDLGWQADDNILVTKLLNRKTDSDYGDIDVLAWSKELRVVVAVECKDLSFAKTYKEIGNQINEFIGRIDEKGKRDRLRKHFDRLDLLTSNISAVSKYVGINSLSRIYGLVVFSKRSVVEYAQQIPRDRIHVCAIEMLTEPKEFIKTLIPWC